MGRWKQPENFFYEEPTYDMGHMIWPILAHIKSVEALKRALGRSAGWLKPVVA